MPTPSLGLPALHRVITVAVCGWLVALFAGSPVASEAATNSSVRPLQHVDTSAFAASAVVPPAGTPDLSQMVLQPSDFSSGAQVTKQGYSTDKTFVADYSRDFAQATTASGARILHISSEVELANDPGEATVVYSLLQGVFRSPTFRQQLARQMSKSVSKRARVRLGDIRFGPVTNLGVGDSSLLMPLSMRVHGVRIGADLVILRVDRVLGVLTLVAVPRKTVSSGDAAGLARAMADHIHVGLSPLNTVTPTIMGSAMQGQTLTVTSGAWSNSPTSFAYQWQHCDAAGANCSPIGGASGQTYTLAAPDAGTTIRVSVTATNAVGSSQPTTSVQTVAVG